jgi:hypothetical protein
MTSMPDPGDPCPGFVVDVGRCWQMVYDRNLQADHLLRGADVDRAVVLAKG